MMSGKNGGTHVIYNNVLRPFMSKHQNKIDNTIENARDISKRKQNTILKCPKRLFF